MRLDIASRSVFEREPASSTDSCVVCTSSISCPSCDKDQECLMSTQTCSECPYYYCSTVDSSGSGNSNGHKIGAIVGGVLGGVVAVLIAGLIYWYFFKKKPIKTEVNDKEFQNYTDENKPSQRDNSTRTTGRLSSYDSFTKPTILNQQGNRNSMATTVSTTNASNILPIAYIPGVTVRPTKANTKSVYSYAPGDTDSIFSDMNTIENASIIGPDYSKNPNGNSNTMTAIKLKPKLVNVDKIEEEEEEEEEEDEFEDAYKPANNSAIPIRLVANGSSSLNQSVSATTLVSSTNNTSPSSNRNNEDSNVIDTIEEINEMDSDSDSDSDSDLGSIHKNEYIQREIILNSENNKRENSPLNESFKNPLLSLNNPQNRDSNGSNVGSFIFDVDLDTSQQPQSPVLSKNIVGNRSTQLSNDSDNASKKSPFDDEYEYEGKKV